MDHLVIPLDEAHARAVADLVAHLTAATAVDVAAERPSPHLTLVAHRGLVTARAQEVVEHVAAQTAPFVLRAHGYGFFTGPEDADLNLHVPVVRTPELDRLHRRLCAALRRAGAEVAGWTDREAWTPHLTLLGRGLDAEGLGRAVAWLAQRHQPRWRMVVDRLELTGGWPERRAPGHVVHLGPGSAGPV